MSREDAQKRRETTKSIIAGYANGYKRSVRDWYSIVVNRWPDGYSDAPAKSTVKKVLQDMCYEQKLSWEWRERGWFRQERFG
jgi:hypothetical protein